MLFYGRKSTLVENYTLVRFDAYYMYLAMVEKKSIYALSLLGYHRLRINETSG